MGNGIGASGASRPRAARALVVAAWVLAAVLAGTVTSWAVAVIGDEHGSSRDQVLSAADVDALLAATTASATPTGTASASASPGTSPGPSPSTVPSADPEPSATATEAPPQPTDPPAAEVVRTWDVTGGRIDASCRGTTFRLLAATPLDGWTVEVDDDAPDGAKVELHREGQESTSRVTCVAGVPTLSERSADDSSEDSSGGSSDD